MKFLRLNLQKLTQNFNNISSILKNSKIKKKKKKIPKHRFQKQECMKCKRIEAYQVKKSLVKLEETLWNKFEGEKRVFGRENKDQSREISRK